MLTTGRLERFSLACALGVMLAVLIGGCRHDEVGSEVISLEGKIEKLKVGTDGTGEITVLYYSDKKQTDVVGVGRVTPETEIMINGAVAKLEELREGDVVRGEVRVDKSGENRTQVALKIYVDRAVPVGSGGP